MAPYAGPVLFEDHKKSQTFYLAARKIQLHPAALDIPTQISFTLIYLKILKYEAAVELVSTVSDVVCNIHTYQADVRANEGLRKRIARTIWWYAAKDGDTWLFAPSKFVGYAGMTAELYLANYAGDMDGRDTEKTMKALFIEVTPGDPAFEELIRGLNGFLHTLGAEAGRRFKGFRVAPDLIETIEPARRAGLEAAIAARIVSDSGICGGRPRIRGTRLRVVDIMEMLADGMSHEEILAEFPYVAREDIQAALAYSARAVDHAIIRAA